MQLRPVRMVGAERDVEAAIGAAALLMYAQGREGRDKVGFWPDERVEGLSEGASGRKERRKCKQPSPLGGGAGGGAGGRRSFHARPLAQRREVCSFLAQLKLLICTSSSLQE